MITREPTSVSNVWTLQSQLNNGSWFLLQTSERRLQQHCTHIAADYDHWKPPPFFDNRSGPGPCRALDVRCVICAGILCMQQLGQGGVGFAGLFNVLSGKPNLNDLTTYTALMHVATGETQVFLQDCPHPCPLW